MAIKLSDYDPAVKYGANIDVAVDLTDIVDQNGNEVLEIDGTASAVNHVRITNAATGGNPELSAQGDDTNASFQLTPAGTGVVLLGNRSTGTISAAGTVTVNAQRGVLTTPVLFLTLNGTAFVVNITNNKIDSSSVVVASIGRGTNTTGFPLISDIDNGNGSAAIRLINGTATVTNGTFEVNFAVL